MDPHWRPVYVLCSTCSFSFKYVIKFENLAAEQSMFAKMLESEDLPEPFKSDKNNNVIATR